MIGHEYEVGASDRPSNHNLLLGSDVSYIPLLLFIIGHLIQSE
jgi:hypothetical protein